MPIDETTGLNTMGDSAVETPAPAAFPRYVNRDKSSAKLVNDDAELQAALADGYSEDPSVGHPHASDEHRMGKLKASGKKR